MKTENRSPEIITHCTMILQRISEPVTSASEVWRAAIEPPHCQFSPMLFADLKLSKAVTERPNICVNYVMRIFLWTNGPNSEMKGDGNRHDNLINR